MIPFFTHCENDNMNIPQFFLTDIFTDRRYGGNQLATFIDG